MGTCIICGTSTNGRICSSHEEDVAFRFEGEHANQLGEGRYYEGTVDGFAEFGVFVDIGDSGKVTGLLHRSELDRRLESLDWDAGETVFVQVTDVHDNGDIDLGWSIRQAPAEFRGFLVHDPNADPDTFEPETGEEGNASAEAEPEAESVAESEPEEAEAEPASEPEESEAEESEPEAAEAETEETEPEPHAEESEPEAEGTEADEPDVEPAEHVPVEDLEDHFGERIRIEGEVRSVHQTGGPTVFEVGDETGTVEAAAFVAAGERAYPEVEAEDTVAVIGEVERHRGDLQIESESVVALEGDAARTVEERLNEAVDEEAAPPETEPLAATPEIESLGDELTSVATALRRAVVESRPVVIRHTATVDGYVGGVALERAVLPLVEEAHAGSDARYHYVSRRPMRDEFYDVGAATDDVTSMLRDETRHDEKHPLFVLVGAGHTEESVDGLGLLETYDAERVVFATGNADDEALAAADEALVTTGVTTATLAAHAAVRTNPDVREDIEPLPAFSYWEEVPKAYADLAAEHGYDDEDAAAVREAVALAAYYQSYEDKRELLEDLFWGEGNTGLAGHVSDQFREKLETALETARPHVEERTVAGTTVSVLDAEAFTHRREFPTLPLILDALRREGDADTLLGAADDELHVRGDGVDLRELAADIEGAVPEGGVSARGADADSGYVEFLVGAREEVIDAAVEAVGEQVAEPAMTE